MASPISVVTPSLNMDSFLRRCIASVSDQGVADVEHIVVDGGSHDDTLKIVKQYPRIQLLDGKDEGMYDALNKGLAHSTGQFIGYLNCDEQYLPGTLAHVMAYFEEHPSVDIVFGDAILIRQDGSLIAFRKGYPPRWPYFLSSHLYLLSCTMFFRRRVLEAGYLFDKSYKGMGDLEFVVRVMRAGFRCMHVPGYRAAFTMTGTNLSMSSVNRAERSRIRKISPSWIRYFRIPLNMVRIAEKAMRGVYFETSPFVYEVYTGTDITKRTRFVEYHPKHQWKFSDAPNRH